jgi:hypothetical protein
MGVKSALALASRWSGRLAHQARALGYPAAARTAPVTTVIHAGRVCSAGVVKHHDGTFSYRHLGQTFPHQASVPASVLAGLTPWERARIGASTS